MFRVTARPHVITARASQSFTFTLYREMRPAITDLDRLADPCHPYHLLALRRWRNINRTNFKCDMVVNKALFSKAVIRSYCKRRLRRTFFQVLEENELDERGRSRASSTRWGEPSGRQIVRGNIMFKAHLGALTTPGLELVQEMRGAVARLFWAHGIREHHLAPQGAHQVQHSSESSQPPHSRVAQAASRVGSRTEHEKGDGRVKGSTSITEVTGSSGNVNGRDPSSDGRPSRSRREEAQASPDKSLK